MIKPNTENLFCWNNVQFLIIELIKIGSNKPSFFSQKRIHQGIAYITFIFGWLMVLFYLISKDNTPMSEFMLWAIPLLAVCGYYLNNTQKEKKEIINPESLNTSVV